MSKIFYVDLQKCTGCHSCQIGCKDEHCGNSWLPYAAEQPEIGQFWCRVDEKERGAGSHVRVSYVPKLGAQTDAIRDYAPEVLMEREDGLIVIDPEKAKGRKDLADKFDGVYWNEDCRSPRAARAARTCSTIPTRPSAFRAALTTARWALCSSAMRASST